MSADGTILLLNSRRHPSTNRTSPQPHQEPDMLQVLLHQQMLYRPAIAMRMQGGRKGLHRLRSSGVLQRKPIEEEDPPTTHPSGHNRSNDLPCCSIPGKRGCK